MRKLFAIVFIFLSFYTSLLAQEKVLIAEGTAPNFYIKHTILAKENYYSVGRMYNVSPKELAPYNNLVFEKGFSLGQTIKIPLNANNFSQGEAPKENEVLIPVYHIMQPKEGLYRVSVNYNKVSPDELKKWNKLSGDAVGAGHKLIIGFLKVIKDQSPLASQAIKNSSDVVNKSDDKKQMANNHEQEKKPVIKEKENEVNNATIKSAINFNGGKFKKLYIEQTKRGAMVFENGVAAAFKSTSGWQDGKYYCFHNTAEPGTIIKITNNANGKSVYAKVLDAIPDIKQNAGLLLRISNAAAEELSAGENKFDCSIDYAK